VLRSEAGRDPYNRELSDLVGALATRSENFRIGWAAHNVRAARDRNEALPSPGRRMVDISFDSMSMPADPGLTLTAYSAEPGTRSEDALKLLASWAAALDQAQSSPATDRT
jgi:hypothetical protein